VGSNTHKLPGTNGIECAVEQWKWWKWCRIRFPSAHIKSILFQK